MSDRRRMQEFMPKIHNADLGEEKLVHTMENRPFLSVPMCMHPIESEECPNGKQKYGRLCVEGKKLSCSGHEAFLANKIFADFYQSEVGKCLPFSPYDPKKGCASGFRKMSDPENQDIGVCVGTPSNRPDCGTELQKLNAHATWKHLKEDEPFDTLQETHLPDKVGNKGDTSNLMCNAMYDFVKYATYDQVDLKKDIPQSEAIRECSSLANKNAFFVQQHRNGNTMCGILYVSTLENVELTNQKNRYGAVCTSQR